MSVATDVPIFMSFIIVHRVTCKISISPQRTDNRLYYVVLYLYPHHVIIYL